MKHPFPRSFLLAALALPLFAQDPAAKTASAAAKAPLMVLKTSQAEFAMMIAGGFEYAGELPEMPAKGHYVLTLGGDRKLQVGTGSGDAGVLDVVADPGLLMDAFAEELDGSRSMVTGAVTVALQQGGMTAKDAAGVVKGLYDFPRQLERIALRVTGDPENPKVKGLDLAFELTGKAGTGFGGFVDALQPCSQGAPVLPFAASAMQMQMSLAPAALQAVLAPFRELVIGMTYQGAEARKQGAALYDQWLAVYDGSAAVAFDGKLQGGILFGVLDGEKVRTMMASPEYAAAQQAAKLADRNLEMEVKIGALEHRGSKLGHSKVTGGEPNPMMPGGTMESWFGAVGNYLAMTLGGGEGDAKALVDGILDGKVKRAPLPGGAFVHVAIDLPTLVGAMAERMPGQVAAGDDMPDKVTLALGKRGSVLTLAVHVQ